MSASQPMMSPQQTGPDETSFEADQEASFASLQKFNQDTNTFGTDGNSIFERRRNDSLHSRNNSLYAESTASFGNQHHGRSDSLIFHPNLNSLDINPNALNMGSTGSESSSQMFAANSFWVPGQNPMLPLDPGRAINIAANAAAAPTPHAISRFGQYTPPEDGPQKLYGVDGRCATKSGLEDVEEEIKGFGCGFSPVKESEFRPASPLTHSKKRRRKCSKDGNPEEEQKREEFLARNRVAASKSRQKKKEWTQSLEEQLKNLQAENTHLSMSVNLLRDQIIAMKTVCLTHVDCDCEPIREYMHKSLEVAVHTSGRRTMLPSPPVPHLTNSSTKAEDSSQMANYQSDKSPSMETESTPHTYHDSPRLSRAGSPPRNFNSTCSPLSQTASSNETVVERDNYWSSSLIFSKKLR